MADTCETENKLTCEGSGSEFHEALCCEADTETCFTTESPTKRGSRMPFCCPKSSGSGSEYCFNSRYGFNYNAPCSNEGGMKECQASVGPDGTTEDSWCCPEFTTCGTERADCLWPNPNLLLVDDDGGGSGGNETGLGTDLEGGGLTGDGSDSPSGNTDVTDTSNSTSNSAAAAPTGVSPGIIAGASIAGVVVVACLLLFLFCRRRRRRKRALPLEEKKISQERWDNAELDAQGDAVERKPHREDSGLQVTSITGWKRWKSRKHQEGGNEPVELDSNQVVVELDHDGARVGAELEEEQKEKFRLEMGSGRDGEVS